MTERSYVLPSETPDGEANRRAALAVIRRFRGDIAEMWDLLEMTGLADAAEALFRQRALSRDLPLEIIEARPVHLAAAAKAAAAKAAVKATRLKGWSVPEGRWCQSGDHKLGPDNIASDRGCRECRNARAKRDRARKTAERNALKARGAA